MSGQESRDKRRTVLYAVLAVAIAAALIIGYFAALRYEQRGQRQQVRQVATQTIGQRRRITWNGRTWRQKTDLTTVLVLGVDRENDEAAAGARSGGQSDFMLLLVFDHPNRQIARLQIDRDTMTEVEVLGILGNAVGTRTMQITLAHSYGFTPEENCKHAVTAVENLLEGIDVNYYISMNLEGIGALNQALGGITLTVPADYTSLDPSLRQGAVVTLDDAQAEILVRSRYEVGDETNEERMLRQRAFISALGDRLIEMAKQDVNSLGEIFDSMESSLTTSMRRGRMINEANRSYNYELLPFETLAGEHRVGETGFMEFYADEDARYDWVLRTFYEPEDA